MLDARPDIVDYLARRAVRQTLAATSAKADAFDVYTALVASMNPEVRKRLDSSLFADEIARSSLSKGQKRELLRIIYLHLEGSELYGAGGGDMLRTARLLLQHS